MHSIFKVLFLQFLYLRLYELRCSDKCVELALVLKSCMLSRKSYFFIFWLPSDLISWRLLSYWQAFLVSTCHLKECVVSGQIMNQIINSSLADDTFQYIRTRSIQLSSASVAKGRLFIGILNTLFSNAIHSVIFSLASFRRCSCRIRSLLVFKISF